MDGEHAYSLIALKTGGDLLPTVVDEQAEVDRNVEVIAENIGLECGAEADGGLEVTDALHERAAWLLGWLAEGEVDEAVEHVDAHA